MPGDVGGVGDVGGAPPKPLGIGVCVSVAALSVWVWNHRSLPGRGIDDRAARLEHGREPSACGERSDSARHDWAGRIGSRAPSIGCFSAIQTIDKLICQCYLACMLDVCTIETPKAAAAVLHPLRNRLLANLDRPASAAGLAAQLDIPRQKVNYHLRELEKLGLVNAAEERQWGGLTERLVIAEASTFVISPAALGPVATDPSRFRDRLSAGYVIALGARLVREVSDLVARTKAAGKRLATLSIDTEVRFRSASERAEFTHELTTAITQLVAKYHDPKAQGGRSHRLIIAAHPLPPTPLKETDHAGEA